MKNIRYICLLVLLTVLWGCHNQTKEAERSNDTIMNVLIEADITYALDGDTARHTVLKYIDFDTIEDLPGFFHILSSKYPIVKWGGDEDEIDMVIDSCIAKIDAYRRGKERFYPDSLVRHCMNYMGFNIAATNNHSPEMADFVLAEWVMMCAAYYSPDITYLVETQTPNHKAGFYNFGQSYNGAPWWSYLFVKREKGYQVFCLGDYVKVRSIFQLSDEQNRTYYLCSNSLTSVEFYQSLFWAKDDNTYLRVAECNTAPLKNTAEYLRYYFDPKSLIWKYAREEQGTDKLIATDDPPVLRLILDGENSCFTK